MALSIALCLISVPCALLCLGCSVGSAQSCFLKIPRTLAASLTHLALVLHLHPAPCTLDSISHSGTSHMHMCILLCAVLYYNIKP